MHILSRVKEQVKMIRNAYKEAYGVKDTELNAQNVRRTEYYKGYLWRLMLGSVSITVPEWWNIDYFRYALLIGGAIGVTEFENVLVPFAYSVVEKNRWYYPTIIRSNDTVNLGERRIGLDCEILYLSEAYPIGSYSISVQSLIDIYAEKLALCDGAIDTNLMVSRTPWLAEVEGSADADNMRYMFTQIMSGRPAVFYRKPKNNQVTEAKPQSPFTRLPVKENFVADITQDAKRQIINEFLTAIGINNANVDKRERLISSEVNANNEELICAVALWQSNVDRCIDKVCRLYPTLRGEISVVFGGEKSESVHANEDIPVET